MKRFRLAALMVIAVCALTAFVGCTTGEPYVPAGKDPVVTAPTIAQDGVLRVGVNANAAPLAGTASGKIVGLDVDIAAAIADTLGLKVSITDVGTDASTALANNTVDIVMGIDKSASDVAFWKSDIYLQTGVVLLAKVGNTAVPVSGSGATFAAQVSSKSAWLIMNEFGDTSLTSTSDLREALNTLNAGAVQYAAADAVIGTYAANGSGIDVDIVALLQQAGGYCVGVSDGNADLKTAISTAVTTLNTNGVINLIEKKWLGRTINLSGVPMTEGAKALAGVASTTETQAAPTEAPAAAQQPATPASVGFDNSAFGYYDEAGNWVGYSNDEGYFDEWGNWIAGYWDDYGNFIAY